MRSILGPIFRELICMLGLWRPPLPPQDEAVEQFAEVNSSYWKTSTAGKCRILVEGHLSDYGPNYLFRTGLAAKAILSALGGGEAEVVVNGYAFQWQTARKAYQSFGITHWIFLGRKFMLIAPLLSLCAWLAAGLRFLCIRTPEQLLDLHLGRIKVGDLIYDEVLRTTRLPTIQSINWAVYRIMVRSWFYYYQYHLLFSLKKYSCYVATHTAYPEYGLLCRVALQRKVVVIETSDIQMSVYRSIGEKDLPTYHQGIGAAIRAELAANEVGISERETLGLESLRRRLESEIKQIDAQKAYSGRVYTRSDLLATVGVAENCKIGFVLAHVFCDSPHLSSSMLHADYYRWLADTIESCVEARNIVWIVKPHPSSALYGEDGLVEALVRGKGADNIYICPQDLNTSSLVNCADVILTVHGTAGLEYSCLGIPVVLAGTPFYAGFGFAHEPQTLAKYHEVVRQAASLERLSQEQISTALQVFYSWERQFDWNNPIVTSEVLASVWGNGAPRDLPLAYELLTANLKVTDPRTLKLWNFASSIARNEQ